jgi:hypothetical protein
VPDESRRRLLSRSVRVSHSQLVGRLTAVGVTTYNHSPATYKDDRCNPKPIAGDRRFPSGVRDESVRSSAPPGPDHRPGSLGSRGARANPASLPDDGPSCSSPPPGRALPDTGGGALRVLGGQREALGDHTQSGRPRPATARYSNTRGSATPVLRPKAATTPARRGPPWRAVRPLNGGARGAARTALLTQCPPNRTLAVMDDG